MLPGHIAAAQVFVHKERLAGAGRPQQEDIVVLNQPRIQGLLLDIEALRNQAQPVTHFQDAVSNANVEAVIQVQAQG